MKTRKQQMRDVIQCMKNVIATETELAFTDTELAAMVANITGQKVTKDIISYRRRQLGIAPYQKRGTPLGKKKTT